MIEKQVIFQLDDKQYLVHILYKRQRNIYFRFRNNEFFVTAPYLCSQKKILEGLQKYGQKLIKTNTKIQTKLYSFEEGYIYLLGKKLELKIAAKFSQMDSAIFAPNPEVLEKNLQQFAVKYLTELTRKYEEIMGINEPHKISVKKMKTRFGSNSYTLHRIHYQLDLIHFREEVISSVVVHELAHDFYHNHQQKFYNCVLKYCPNYYSLKKELREKRFL